ncbi:MAG: ComF family protein [Acutalibacteraceae bacterium]
MRFDRFSRLFFPKRCSLCGDIVPIDQDYCSCGGKHEKRISSQFCEHCGHDKDNCVCGFLNSAYFEHIVAVFVYTGIIKTRICDFKFCGERKESDFFSSEMSSKFCEAFPLVKADIVTFVPMTEKSERERGYNQSKLLALGVSKRLLVPCEQLLVKNRETGRQRDLTAKERQNNLDGAFSKKENAVINGKTVILCDDIKTTGTTLSKCVSVLKENGAKEVYCLCAAVSDYSPDLTF